MSSVQAVLVNLGVKEGSSAASNTHKHAAAAQGVMFLKTAGTRKGSELTLPPYCSMGAGRTRPVT